IDSLGGPVAASVFAVVLALLVLLDTFGLPAIVGTRDFVDFCSGEPTQRAGGFALALMVLTALSVLALRLAAPRSPVASLIFLAVILGAQSYVAANTSLQSVLRQDPFADIVEFAWPCPQLFTNIADSFETEEFLNLLYNPGPPGSGGGDLPTSFTNMLAVNLVLMAAFTVLSFLAAGIRAAVVALSRRDPPGPAPEPIRWLRGPERVILVQSTLAIISTLIIGPIVLLYAEAPATASASLVDLLWVGPVIVMLDLARLMLVPARAGAVDAAEDAPDTSAPDTPLILGGVAADLKREFGDQAVLGFELPPATQTAAPTPDGLAAIPGPGQSRYLPGTLKAETYGDILDSLTRGVLDTGRAALVICPNDAIQDFSRNILDGLARSDGARHTRAWVANTELSNEDGAVDILIASPELLNTILDQVEGVRAELATLGGIVILGLHRMDLGLLALGLRRLKDFVEHPKEMIALVQSEARANAVASIRTLPLLNELRDPRSVPVRDLDRQGPAHVLVLRVAQNETFAEQRRAHWPVWARALLSVRQGQPRATPYVFDAEAAHPAGIWREQVIQTLQGTVEPDIDQWARTLPSPQITPHAAAHPAAFLTDPGNLADAVQIGVAEETSHETLRVITTRSYPGASFLQSELARETDTFDAAARSDGLRRFCARFGSVYPQPQGGPIELALLVRQEYSSAIRLGASDAPRGGELRQDRLDRIWTDRAEPLEKLGISNTRIGLERLFRQTHRIPSTASFVSREQGEDRRWTYRLAEQSLANPDTLAMVSLELTLGAGLPGSDGPSGAAMPLADHGLSYAEGVRLLINGDIYQVQTVNTARRSALVQASNAADLVGYTFVRDYALRADQDGHVPGFAAEARTPVQQTEQPFEIATGYAHIARRTQAHLEHRRSGAPFGPTGQSPLRSDTQIVSDYRLRSMALLRIYDAAPSSGAARRGRGPRGPVTRRTAPGGGDGGLVLTLATSLQDVLGLIFRPLAHRIAVVSPDLTAPPREGDGNPDGATAFCLDRQPALVAPGGADPFAHVGMRHRLSDPARAAYGTLFDAFIEQARARENAPETAHQTRLTLAVIEDSDHDLGVARYLNEHTGEVLRLWSDYLRHYAQEPVGTPGHDYGFGAAVAPSCYDFIAAAELVEKML
ncbi:MAG: hypothetical protein AAF914_06585, partial [Pseudomonadota bacterium]